MNRERDRRQGFTLIELLVVLAILATLLSVAAPRYFGSVERSKEAALKESLAVLRDSINKFYADTGKYPDTLNDLVTKKYLRKIPVDPVTDSTETWIVIPPNDPKKGSLSDVVSGAEGAMRDGTLFKQL